MFFISSLSSGFTLKNQRPQLLFPPHLCIQAASHLHLSWCFAKTGWCLTYPIPEMCKSWFGHQQSHLQGGTPIKTYKNKQRKNSSQHMIAHLMIHCDILLRDPYLSPKSGTPRNWTPWNCPNKLSQLYPHHIPVYLITSMFGIHPQFIPLWLCLLQNCSTHTESVSTCRSAILIKKHGFDRFDLPISTIALWQRLNIFKHHKTLSSWLRQVNFLPLNYAVCHPICSWFSHAWVIHSKKKVDDVPLSKKEQHEKQNELLRSQ